MKSKHPALRAHFEVTEKTRKVESLEMIIIDLEHMAAELARAYFDRGGAYKGEEPWPRGLFNLGDGDDAARTKVLNSLADLRAKLDMARGELEDAEAKLHPLELFASPSCPS
jgi:hypothetical protein